MRLVFRTACVLVLGLFALLLVLALLVLERQPRLSETAVLTPEHIDHAKRLLDANDPRRMPYGVLRQVVISQADLDIALNYAANRFARGGASIKLGQGSAHVQASVALPGWAMGRYLNVDAGLRQTTGLPEFDHLRLGALPVPASLANAIWHKVLKALQSSGDFGLAANVVKTLTARPGQLGVLYAWNGQAADQLKGALVPKDDQARMKAYQIHLAQFTNTPRANLEMPLSMLLQSLLSLASERGGDSVAEHRAAMVVLAFYVNGKGLAHLVPQAQTWAPLRQYKVTLDGRHDFAQHFSISAALAATAGSPLADAVGLYKEVDDSRGGSGFSFNDIAADRAGTRFGDLVTTSAARKLQPMLTEGLKDSDLLPQVKDLPEFMQESEFKRRYGGIGGANYNAMMADIESRIAGLALYR
jgi:hypothetical protein